MKSLNFIKDIFKGICIGAGAILPGISSGVLCVIFGIYDKLVDSVLGLFHNFKKNFLFLLPLGIGGIIGIVLLGNLLEFFFRTYPMPTKYAFIGLILGSIPLLIQKIHMNRSFHKHYIIYTIIAFGIGLLMILLEKYIENSMFFTASINFTTLLSTASPLPLNLTLFLIITGFFMSIGIVVPGVSSTLILMCFGVYDTYLEAVSLLSLNFLIPLGIGVILGSIVFLKMIKYLFDHYYMQTFYSIIGFTLGSVLVLYMPLTFNLMGFISILLLITCFYIAGLFEKKEQ